MYQCFQDQGKLELRIYSNEDIKRKVGKNIQKCVKMMECGKYEFETSSERGLKVRMKGKLLICVIKKYNVNRIKGS